MHCVLQGLIGVEFLHPDRRSVSQRVNRVIVGCWHSQDDWKSWHEDPAFLETRTELEESNDESGQSRWYEVVVEAR